MFFKIIRFGREHFYKVLLAAMKLDGNKSILCGRKGTGTFALLGLFALLRIFLRMAE